MSSILTNQGAMVALQTMKSINRDMGTVQNQISTGLKVGSAKDNSAIWAIGKTMSSDAEAMRTVQSSIAVGQSTVAVARNAVEASVDLLGEMKSLILQAGKTSTTIRSPTTSRNCKLKSSQF
jgi:flagellin